MSIANAPTREVFQFAAEPRTVQSKSKYRNQTISKQPDYEGMQNDNRVRANRSSQNNRGSRQSARRNTHGQTEETAVEEIYMPMNDRKIQDESKLVPDYYIDRPPTPEYKPLPPGVDVATQIEDYELFDYVLEVEPVLQVLVGKTIEQAQTELREDEERIDEMRNKMRFEKVRNAELMVTQRKEALHIRKQEEKQRREKQHIIEKEEKAIIHKKLISRLLGKNVMTAMDSSSLRILADQNVLNVNLRSELRRLYNPYLVANTVDFINQSELINSNIQQLTNEISIHYKRAHAQAVQQENDRIQKIQDDQKAEEERQAAARKRRRERRRLLRLHFAKANFLDVILATVVSKGTEIEGPFSGEASDIFPTGKESVSTIGGLLGELWLIIDVLQQESHVEIGLNELVQIFVHILNENFKGKDLQIYLREESQQIVQEVIERMTSDLIAFNRDKSQNIDDIADQLGDINLFQNLAIIYSEELLNPDILRVFNKALLYIFFTSFDYKIPEKKEVKILDPQLENIEPQNVEEGEEAGSNQPPTEENNTIQVEQSEEEEFKLPEITPFEQSTEQAKHRLKLNFIKDWDLNKECNAIVRVRIPLNRNTKEGDEVKEEAEEENKPNSQNDLEASIKSRKTNREATEQPVITEPQEDFAEKVERLIATDDFIEPFNGATFEDDKVKFTEQVSNEGGPLRVYNTSLIEGKCVAQVNERGQEELRKELLTVLKECIPSWKELQNEELLAKIYVKYKKNEKFIIKGLVNDSEETPVFDIEN